MTRTFILPAVWAEKYLRPILDEARKSPGEGNWDSVLAQVETEPFDSAAGNGETAGTRIVLRVAVVPNKTVPKVRKMIDAERARAAAKEAMP